MSKTLAEHNAEAMEKALLTEGKMGYVVAGAVLADKLLGNAGEESAAKTASDLIKAVAAVGGAIFAAGGKSLSKDDFQKTD